jgi:V-type H+-transporting ATPase subunit B
MAPRLSDKELAAINAAAVTKEYNVKPRIGALSPSVCVGRAAEMVSDYRTVSSVNGYILNSSRASVPDESIDR